VKLSVWQKQAETRLCKILKLAYAYPSLRRRVHSLKIIPKKWGVDLSVVGSVQMQRLNQVYRKKNYPTDVLSFPAPPIFRETGGYLGELVICIPTLQAQAASLEHSERTELDVLLIHGVLHLIGLDHEAGRHQAIEMARWEVRLFNQISPSGGHRRKVVRKTAQRTAQKKAMIKTTQSPTLISRILIQTQKSGKKGRV
jgi:rRNA maturation RNase YbeY